MKKLFAIILLISATCNVKAQDMSFEETLKYIHTQGQKMSSYFNFPAKKNGDIILTDWTGSTTINFFDLSGGCDENDKLPCFDGIQIQQNIPSGKYFISFYVGGKYQGGTDFLGTAMIDVERLYNAIQHLRKVSVYVKDPFDK